MTVLAARYRALWDSLDTIEATRKEITTEMNELESEMRDAMRHAGKHNDGDADTIAGVARVTWRSKWRAVYEPGLWSSIVKWAVDNNHEYIVQRRLTDAKIMSLIDQGVPLPEGLTVEPYDDLDIRRL
jgi:hypothetical protein